MRCRPLFRASVREGPLGPFSFLTTFSLELSHEYPHDCGVQHSPRLEALLESALALLVLIPAVFLVRQLFADLPAYFHDEGETLYRTMLMLRGGVPYRDDLTHHFVGYVIPYLLAAPFLGLTDALPHQLGTVNQVLVGLGVFLCLRLLTGFAWSLVAALLAACAREPWVESFYVQHELNLLQMAIWYGCLRYILRGSRCAFLLAGVVAGLSFVFDQRAVAFIAYLPIALMMRQRVQREAWGAVAGWGLVSVLIAPACAAAYLVLHGAFSEFIQQTIVFPALYRRGSQSVAASLWQGILLHRYLFTLSPLLALGAVFGLFGVYRMWRDRPAPWQAAVLFLLLTAIPLIPMQMLGGRDYNYYTITMLPLMAALAAFGYGIFQENRGFRLVFLIFLTLPTVLGIVEAGAAKRDPIVRDYRGDGLNETVDFLQKVLLPTDTLYVWNYRLAIYTRLGRLAPTRSANEIMIHPDSLVLGPERIAHVFPRYETEFLNWISRTPPTYIVWFDRTGQEKRTSRVRDVVESLIAAHYREVFSIQRRDLTRSDCTYRVFQKNEKVQAEARFFVP